MIWDEAGLVDDESAAIRRRSPISATLERAPNLAEFIAKYRVVSPIIVPIMAHAGMLLADWPHHAHARTATRQTYAAAITALATSPRTRKTQPLLS